MVANKIHHGMAHVMLLPCLAEMFQPLGLEGLVLRSAFIPTIGDTWCS